MFLWHCGFFELKFESSEFTYFKMWDENFFISLSLSSICIEFSDTTQDQCALVIIECMHGKFLTSCGISENLTFFCRIFQGKRRLIYVYGFKNFTKNYILSWKPDVFCNDCAVLTKMGWAYFRKFLWRMIKQFFFFTSA